MAGEGQYSKADGDTLYGKDVNISYFQGSAASTLNHASVDCNTTATLIKAANTSRKGILIKNNSSSENVYIGLSGVTTSDGYELEAGEEKYFYHKEAVYGITASGTVDVRYLEVE